MPLGGGTPAWPGSPGAIVERLKSLADGDPAEVTSLTLDVHTGTHVDAPAHMLGGAPTMDGYALESGIGEVIVADSGEASLIDAGVLASLDLPEGCTRLLLRTANSARPKLQEEFASDYAALTVSGAEWLVSQRIELIGIDYVSIQLFDDPIETHLVLFRAGIVILEGLRLEAVEPGSYELLCLPLPLAGAEASPARAVLRKPDA